MLSHYRITDGMFHSMLAVKLCEDMMVGLADFSEQTLCL